MGAKTPVSFKVSEGDRQVWQDFQDYKGFDTRQQAFDFATHQLKKILEKRNYGNYGHDQRTDSAR